MTVAGVQEPRILSAPPYVTTLGVEACELAERAGLKPDPWQELVIHHALGRRADGKWAAFEVGVNVPRQNGKGGLLEIRELAGLFILEERLIIHSAHQFDTSLEAFRRLLMLVEDTPDLARQVKRVSRSHGEEGIELFGGRRIRFRTRTKGGGRGFSGQCLIFDEAMMISAMSHGALLPTLSAQEDPQVWYTGSAVDQQTHDDGVVFARVRERARKGKDPSLAFFEWSADDEDGKLLPEGVTDKALADRGNWAAANPGLGIRINADHIDNEMRSLDARNFAVERLGIGDWPPTDKVEASVISMELWRRLTDGTSRPRDPVCFALDVSPSRGSASIGVAGLRSDGLPHVEVVDQREGTGWIVDRCKELQRKHQPLGFVVDERGPAASLITDLKEAGVKLILVSIGDVTQACSTFFDYCDQEKLRHLGTPELKVALKGAKTRPLGDSWAWARKKSTVDITPLVAVTLALWGTMRERASVYEEREVIAV